MKAKHGAIPSNRELVTMIEAAAQRWNLAPSSYVAYMLGNGMAYIRLKRGDDMTLRIARRIVQLLDDDPDPRKSRYAKRYSERSMVRYYTKRSARRRARA